MGLRKTGLGRLTLCLVVWTSFDVHAATLKPELQAKVRAATFEVVMKKPEKDSLSYERALPLELLPYSERTNAYISQGTAFAVGENRFVTAAHVLRPGFKSNYGEPALRSADGKVYAIERILKYAEHKDFAVFSLREPPQAHALEAARDATLDAPVFAVGNALGEGVVVRDGLLTSNTPEQRDGRWNWIRFSAAASPGNSGGPLLDEQGRVIGVVLRKSPNENLNFALPIAEVMDAPEKVAHLERETGYRMPMFRGRQTGLLSAQVALPKTYREFADEVIRIEEDHYAELRKTFLEKKAEVMFPRGPGARPLLHSPFTIDSLSLIGQKEDDTWDFYYIAEPAVTMLDANGYVSVGTMGEATYLKIRRPDGADVRQFYFDSKHFMDLILKGMPWKRSVGREEVRILSMGKARTESEYMDAYGRKWQVRVWDAEFHDLVAVSIALPTPDGYLGAVQWTQPIQENYVLEDMKNRASFAHLALVGSLAQWDEYLAIEELRPPALSQVRIEKEYGKYFRYRSPRLDFEFTEKEQSISPESVLRLGYGYFEEGGEIRWDVTAVGVTQDLAAQQAIAIQRHSKPPATLPREFGVYWEQIEGRVFPFNAHVLEANGASMIATIYPYPAGAGALETDVAYQFTVLKQGKQTQEDMHSLLLAFMDKLKIHGGSRGTLHSKRDGR